MLPKLTTIVIVPEITKISAIIQKLAGALILIQGKRNTLEDKAIASNFVELLSIYSQTLDELCLLLKKKEEGFSHSTNSSIMEILNSLSELNSSTETLLEDCLKALSYNYNYFEQYYEYDFVAKLNEQQLQSQLLGLKARLNSTTACS